MLPPDDIMTRVGLAIGMGHAGEREEARQELGRLWAEVGDEGDALHRVAIAHSLADLQDDVDEQIAWDLRALAAAELVSEERLARANVASGIASFYPSLHLNLGEGYRKKGELGLAARHCEAGRSALEALPEDGYVSHLRSALDRLAQHIDDERGRDAEEMGASRRQAAPARSPHGRGRR